MHYESPYESEGRIRMHRPTALLYQVIALLSSLAVGIAHAQDYPNKPIRLIIPYAAGSSGETTFRLVAPTLEARLGQHFIIESRPGASGNTGAQEVARAAPNGYTLLLAAMSVFVGNQFFYKSPAVLLQPITLLSETPTVVLVSSDLPVSNMRQLVTYAKSHPGKLNFSSPGSGSAPHLAGLIFADFTGIDIVHIPYKGGVAATSALLTKDIQISFYSLTAVETYLRSGRVKALAVDSPKRLALLPDLPTVAESGFPVSLAGAWWGLAAPKDTDPKIVNRLAAEMGAALSEPAISSRLAEIGMFPGGQSPAEFTLKIQTETAELKKTLEKLQILPE